MLKKPFTIKDAAEQIIGREGETATFFLRCVVTFSLREFGFVPRQFNRSVLSGSDAKCVRFACFGVT